MGSVGRVWKGQVERKREILGRVLQCEGWLKHEGWIDPLFCWKGIWWVSEFDIVGVLVTQNIFSMIFTAKIKHTPPI